MAVLGVSYGFHDATAALAIDGRLLAVAAEERYTRQKHDANFPSYAIDMCLRRAGCNIDDIAAVYFHEDPATTFSRVLASSLAGFPGSRREFVASMKSWFGKKLWVKLDIASRLGKSLDQVKTLSHHRSHAFQAFLGSGFEESAVVTVDAVGEWATTTISHLQRVNGALPKESLICSSSFPNSLGLFYSTITAYLGFQPMEGECSTMALAAFGRPSYLPILNELVWVEDDGTVVIDHSAFNFDRFYDRPYTESLIARLGIEPRELGVRYTFDSMDNRAYAKHEQVYADLAASAQELFENAMVKLAKVALRESGSRNLCIAGGGALNCVANRHVLLKACPEKLYVPPDPGDGGAAVGAALYGSLVEAESTPSEVCDSLPSYRPYSGAFDEEQEQINFVEHLDPRHQDRYAKLGNKPSRDWCYESKEYSNQTDLCKATAAYLEDGLIVGWIQGDFESGPRALGNRSILIRPDDPSLASKLSTQVKERARFRPYALAVLDVAAFGLLPEYDPDQTPFKWMQLASPVAIRFRDQIRAAIHIDGTTRPQVVSASDNPRFHELLSHFCRLTTLPGVINTSFNESGYPIASGPIDGMVMFARTAMDVLVVGNQIIRKVRS